MRCECCPRRATRTCGLDDQPALCFCDECFARHVRDAHPDRADEILRLLR